jgi:putative transposase
MRQLNGVYTQAYNKRHDRVGHLFQGRFKGILVQKDSHLLEVCRYVVLNPVGAKTISHPRLYKWSSYRATAGTAQAHPCLTAEEILNYFGDRKAVAQQKYRQFVQDGIGSSSIWDELKAQSLLGVEGFADDEGRTLVVDSRVLHTGLQQLGRSRFYQSRLSKCRAI